MKEIKMKTHLFILALALGTAMQAQADTLRKYELEYEAKIRAEEESYASESKDVFNYNLAGEKQGGAFNFFVKDTMLNGLDDPTADALNAMAPAAGVQFTIDFSL